MKNPYYKTILYGVMDWGLGHATRSVPLIQKFVCEGHRVILASAGNAKIFLENYFPELTVLEKPAYNIRYSAGYGMTAAIARQLPKLVSTISKEKKWVSRIAKEYDVSQIISDNCYGFRTDGIHSVFITHQLNIRMSSFRWMEPWLKYFNYSLINNFTECHIPDFSDNDNLSGALSHGEKMPRRYQYIGSLSRFAGKKIPAGKSYDFVALLSGPEPHRTLFEEKVAVIFRKLKMNCCIVRGLPGDKNHRIAEDHITWYNHADDGTLLSLLANAGQIISRAGYSSVMDLKELGRTALLVPTPGQTEQEYLALHLSEKDFTMCDQEFLSEEILLKSRI